MKSPLHYFAAAAAAGAMLLCSTGAQAGIVNLDFITITQSNINGVGGDVTGTTGASHGSVPSQTWTANVANQDLDGDGTADPFSFTVTATASSANGVSIWGQGVNTSNGGGTNTSFGIGTGNSITLTGALVGAPTTSLGETISFDGYTGGGIGLGHGQAQTASIDINGTTSTVSTPGGGFVFSQGQVDFAPTASVVFDNEVKTGGSTSVRTFDVQFSSAPVVTVPEPTSLALIGLAGGLMAVRRRK
jgi:hypothetical protein